MLQGQHHPTVYPIKLRMKIINQFNLGLVIISLHNQTSQKHIVQLKKIDH